MNIQRVRAIFMTLDPVHVGAGGHGLGRVDNSIVREPGTNLPKIPGTSLSGAARSYAAMAYNKPEAAGQHKKFSAKQGKHDSKGCPILYTFGTSSDSGAGTINRAGTVSICDARILFFPVASATGPLWVTTESLLNDAGLSKVRRRVDAADKVITFGLKGPDVNLGWLRLETKPGGKPEDKEETRASFDPRPAFEPGCQEAFDEMLGRLVMPDWRLMSAIVNSNLEIRTSVSINPETGAAADGALFTYEAIPRATWLYADIVKDDFVDKFPGKITNKFDEVEGDNRGEPLGKNLEWDDPLKVVKTGLEMIELLGVGGMGTRGFGRMRLMSWEPMQ